MRSFSKSEKLFREAQQVLVGGVNSPVRAFKAVGGTPLFIRKGKGPWIWDADGNKYLDFVGSWGPLILGHAQPQVLAAARKAMADGLTFGAPTALEIELARRVREAFPSMEKVRFVSSGTEAAMSALRLARGVTRRDKVIKFTGAYHGHADGLLVKAGSGVSTLGIAECHGVPRSYTQETIVLPYNNSEKIRSVFAQMGEQIAAVIVEPVAGNMGVVPPAEGFLKTLRKLTNVAGALLIFDEVITGFRLAYGGAQEIFKIRPDLTCLGKILGGGFPAAAYGGRKDLMDQLAPEGPVYQAGTLSGNPVAMAAGIATLDLLKKTKPYAAMQKRTATLTAGIRRAAEAAGLPAQVQEFGSMFTVFFSGNAVTDYDSAKLSNPRLYSAFFHALLRRGVYFPPAQYEACFVSAAHDERALRFAAQAVEQAFQDVRRR